MKFKCHLNHQNHNSNSKPKPKPKQKPLLLESLATTIWNTLRKPVVAAILLIGILLTTYNPNTSLAAPSGGRMGGRAFSKSSSSPSYSAPLPSFSASSSSSSSYSAPSSSWSHEDDEISSYSIVPSPPSLEFSYSAEPSPFRVQPAVSYFDVCFRLLTCGFAILTIHGFLIIIFGPGSPFFSDRDEGSVLTNTAAVETTLLEQLQVI